MTISSFNHRRISQIIFLIIILTTLCNAQQDSSASGTNLKEQILIEKQIENQQAQAEYYRELLAKLNDASKPLSWKDIINSNLTLLLLGFILTTVAGGLLSSRLQKESWRRQTQLDLFKKRYDEGIQFLDSISKLVGNRFFNLQRFVWAISDSEQDKLKEIELDYFKIVMAWNSSLRMNRNKIRLLIGEVQAAEFLDYQDDYRGDSPQSLHYCFAKAHNFAIKAKKKAFEVSRAQKEVDQLNWMCSRFLEKLTTDFLKQAESLQLLKAPELPKERSFKPK